MSMTHAALLTRQARAASLMYVVELGRVRPHPPKSGGQLRDTGQFRPYVVRESRYHQDLKEGREVCIHLAS